MRLIVKDGTKEISSKDIGDQEGVASFSIEALVSRAGRAATWPRRPSASSP